jgi:WD40 repeat protein
MVASLTDHTNCVLYLAMIPDGETIVTAAGDETLRHLSFTLVISFLNPAHKAISMPGDCPESQFFPE